MKECIHRVLMTSIDILPKKKEFYRFRTNTSETNEFYVLFSKLVLDKKKISLFIFDWVSAKLFDICFTTSLNMHLSRCVSYIGASEKKPWWHSIVLYGAIPLKYWILWIFILSGKWLCTERISNQHNTCACGDAFIHFCCLSLNKYQ